MNAKNYKPRQAWRPAVSLAARSETCAERDALSTADKTATRMAVLTPAGRGAIAVVAVAGECAAAIVDSFFHSASGRPIAEQPVNRICFGHWGSPNGEEIVVCRRAATIEIHCHGGRAAVQAVCCSLREGGCEQIDSANWLQQAEPNPIRADARRALAEAVTEQAALILLDQYNGALQRAIERAVSLVKSGDIAGACALVQTLIDRWSVGRRLVTPAQIVLTGPPNVGKSSLINALVGYDRAIVFDAPGTTRDAVAATSAVEGWPVEFVDTAGLRQPESPLEQAGIDLARAAIAGADLLLVLTDAADWERASLAHDTTPKSRNVIHVANKFDLLTGEERSSFSRTASSLQPVPTCAVTGEGIGELLRRIAQTIVPHPPQSGDAIPFRDAQVDTLHVAVEFFKEGKSKAAVQALRAMLATSVDVSHADLDASNDLPASL